MISKEILKKIRRIQITTSRLVTDVFAGQYQSIFKGRGIEFDEVREYLPGDDIRSIDWNVTARTGQPHIKKFVEERELTVMFLIDLSASSKFGTVDRFKSELQAEICSVLALSANKNNDKVGLITFTDKVEKFLPPRKGMKHVLRVIREALYYEPEGKGTNIKNAVEFLHKVVKRRCVCFVISDYFDDGFKKALSIANKRHDMIAVTVTDPREHSLQDAGLINLQDAETGDFFLIDSSSEAVRNAFRNRSEKRMKKIKDIFNSIGVDNIEISTDKPYSQNLYRFFKMRERRIRRR